MSLIGSDGLEYETLADRILGQPKDNRRNGNIEAYRQLGYREDAIRAYQKAFDTRCPEGYPVRGKEFSNAHSEGIEAAYATGGFGPPDRWADNPAFRPANRYCPSPPGGTGLPASLPAPPSSLHAADQP